MAEERLLDSVGTREACVMKGARLLHAAASQLSESKSRELLWSLY